MQPDPRQRRRRRRHLFYYLKVFDGATGRLLGHLVDVTQDGLMLLASQPLPTDSAYRLRLELPQELDGQHELLLDARAVWCRRDVNPDYYGVGFELVRIARGSRGLVESMIYKFGFAD